MADTMNYRVQVLTADGKYFRSISCTSKPQDVAVDNAGKVHVPLFHENKLQIFTSVGKKVRSLDINGSSGIAIDCQGYLFASSYCSNQLFIITPQDKKIDGCKVEKPLSIAIDTQGCVYVASYSGKCVKKYLFVWLIFFFDNYS